jgi:hypothetical protein
MANGWRLEIPAGEASAYRFAQLDDYSHLSRNKFPRYQPFGMSLRARVSGNSIPGTWGFGLWNDPFGMSLGFGGKPFRLPALPNAAWFFHASKENWLSLSGNAGNGFLAQVFHSPKIPSPLLLLPGTPLLPLLAFVRSRTWLRKIASHIIKEDGILLELDATIWHSYKLDWSNDHCSFRVDDQLLLDTNISPKPPLGLVIWLDNQFVAFRPDGRLGFGVLENEPAWMEVKEMEWSQLIK